MVLTTEEQGAAADSVIVPPPSATSVKSPPPAVTRPAEARQLGFIRQTGESDVAYLARVNERIAALAPPTPTPAPATPTEAIGIVPIVEKPVTPSAPPSAELEALFKEIDQANANYTEKVNLLNQGIADRQEQLNQYKSQWDAVSSVRPLTDAEKAEIDSTVASIQSQIESNRQAIQQTESERQNYINIKSAQMAGIRTSPTYSATLGITKEQADIQTRINVGMGTKADYEAQLSDLKAQGRIDPKAVVTQLESGKFIYTLPQPLGTTKFAVPPDGIGTIAGQLTPEQQAEMASGRAVYLTQAQLDYIKTANPNLYTQISTNITQAWEQNADKIINLLTMQAAPINIEAAKLQVSAYASTDKDGKTTYDVSKALTEGKVPKEVLVNLFGQEAIDKTISLQQQLTVARQEQAQVTLDTILPHVADSVTKDTLNTLYEKAVRSGDYSAFNSAIGNIVEGLQVGGSANQKIIETTIANVTDPTTKSALQNTYDTAKKTGDYSAIIASVNNVLQGQALGGSAQLLAAEVATTKTATDIAGLETSAKEIIANPLIDKDTKTALQNLLAQKNYTALSSAVSNIKQGQVLGGVEGLQKIETSSASFQSQLKMLPQELQDAYAKGGVEGYNVALTVYKDKVMSAQNALEPYKTTLQGAFLMGDGKIQAGTDVYDIQKYITEHPNDIKAIKNLQIMGFDQKEIDKIVNNLKLTQSLYNYEGYKGDAFVSSQTTAVTKGEWDAIIKPLSDALTALQDWQASEEKQKYIEQISPNDPLGFYKKALIGVGEVGVGFTSLGNIVLPELIHPNMETLIAAGKSIRDMPGQYLENLKSGLYTKQIKENNDPSQMITDTVNMILLLKGGVDLLHGVVKPAFKAIDPIGKLEVNGTTFWDGIKVADNPLVGLSKGKVVFGKGGIELPTAEELKLPSLEGKPFEPRTGLEAKVLSDATAMAKIGFSPENIAKIQATIPEVKAFAGKPSPYLNEYLITKEIGSLNSNGVEAVLRQGVQDSNIVGKVTNYGSYSLRTQLSPEALTEWTIKNPDRPADIDVQLSTKSVDEANAFAQRLTKSINDANGSKAGKLYINPDKPHLIVGKDPATGKEYHVIDIHLADEPIIDPITGQEVSPTKNGEFVYGFAKKSPEVIVDLPGIGEVRLAGLAETGIGKTEQVLGWRLDKEGKPTIATEAHRVKDYIDLYEIIKTYSGAERADAWASSLGLDLDTLKVLSENIAKDSGWEFSPSRGANVSNIGSVTPQVKLSNVAMISAATSKPISITDSGSLLVLNNPISASYASAIDPIGSTGNIALSNTYTFVGSQSPLSYKGEKISKKGEISSGVSVSPAVVSPKLSVAEISIPEIISIPSPTVPSAQLSTESPADLLIHSGALDMPSVPPPSFDYSPISTPPSLGITPIPPTAPSPPIVSIPSEPVIPSPLMPPSLVSPPSPPSFPSMPIPPKPTKRIKPSDVEKQKSLEEKIKPGTAVWIQGSPKGGRMYRVIVPPYGQEESFSMRTLPPGYRDEGWTGEGSAKESLQIIGGLPEKDIENIDLGWTRINIRVATGKPEIEYVHDADANVGERSQTVGQGKGQIPLQAWEEAKSQGVAYEDFVRSYKGELVDGYGKEKVVEPTPQTETVTPTTHDVTEPMLQHEAVVASKVAESHVKKEIDYQPVYNELVALAESLGYKIVYVSPEKLLDYEAMNPIFAKTIGYPMPDNEIHLNEKYAKTFYDKANFVYHEMDEMGDIQHGDKYWQAHTDAYHKESQPSDIKAMVQPKPLPESPVHEKVETLVQQVEEQRQLEEVIAPEENVTVVNSYVRRKKPTKEWWETQSNNKNKPDRIAMARSYKGRSILPPMIGGSL